MNNIKSFSKIFEAAPRIPRLNEKGLQYWKNKGKNGKDVMIYTHDDMDGIYSAIVIKERLKDLGYNIKGYGVLNYQDAWKNTHLDPKMINVAVDFANMPNPERKDLIDIYIDHHGEYTEEEKEYYKDNPVVKTKTGSAYEGICLVIGKPTDEIALYSIDMIDSAKYDDYNVDWRDILNFSWDRFREISNKPGKVTIKPFKESKPVTLGWPIIAKLTFAGAFNQFLKRSDHKTVIETIDNLKDVSIYNIYNVMKKVYPGNNTWFSGASKGKPKDFIEDSTWRINTMKQKTRGRGTKKIFTSQREFVEETGMQLDGYQIIGNLMWVPSGTWANALRARSILLSDIDNGIVPEGQVKFIALQYGNTIQVCSFSKLEDMTDDDLPTLKNGVKMKDLGEYMSNTLKNFQKFFGYSDPDTSIGQDELTVSGGHVGIGTISNIVGHVDNDKIPTSKKTTFTDKYNGYRYLDLIRNKIISDLSGIQWNIALRWPESGDDNPLDSIIRDIINMDPDLQQEIKDYIEDNKEFESRLGESNRTIRKKISNRLKNMDKKEIENWHQKVMMNHKVMMKDEIRQIDREGKISERFNNIKSFNQFNESQEFHGDDIAFYDYFMTNIDPSDYETYEEYEKECLEIAETMFSHKPKNMMDFFRSWYFI